MQSAEGTSEKISLEEGLKDLREAALGTVYVGGGSARPRDWEQPRKRGKIVSDRTVWTVEGRRSRAEDVMDNETQEIRDYKVLEGFEGQN